jgi:hypothetical protein
MAEDMDTDTTPAAQDDNVAPPVDEEELNEGLRSLALVVVAFVGAIAFLEIVRWGARRLERRLAMRHPLLTELAEELADPDWHLR